MRHARRERWGTCHANLQVILRQQIGPCVVQNDGKVRLAVRCQSNSQLNINLQPLTLLGYVANRWRQVSIIRRWYWRPVLALEA